MAMKTLLITALFTTGLSLLGNKFSTNRGARKNSDSSDSELDRFEVLDGTFNNFGILTGANNESNHQKEEKIRYQIGSYNQAVKKKLETEKKCKPKLFETTLKNVTESYDPFLPTSLRVGNTKFFLQDPSSAQLPVEAYTPFFLNTTIDGHRSLREFQQVPGAKGQLVVEMKDGGEWKRVMQLRSTMPPKPSLQLILDQVKEGGPCHNLLYPEKEIENMRVALYNNKLIKRDGIPIHRGNSFMNNNMVKFDSVISQRTWVSDTEGPWVFDGPDPHVADNLFHFDDNEEEFKSSNGNGGQPGAQGDGKSKELNNEMKRTDSC